MHTSRTRSTAETALIVLDHHHVLASAAQTFLPHGHGPEDVDLDPGLLARAIARTHDVIILFGEDRDLSPAVERAERDHHRHIELAQWSNGDNRRHPLAHALRSPWWHNLDRDVLTACTRIRPRLLAA
ncbi:hypothetical protein [Tomitella gaofuii]|uniref:hypothetical protein n=1 Tax=Tomitella gaofuii TaxID=2760083 RepID=UPI0015FD8365|nr:hypothetical protein [Tomitella gaofuii]